MKLAAREVAVLQHVRRYGLSTNDVMDRKFYRGRSDARKQKIRSLLKADLLQAFTLFERTRYYTLGSSGPSSINVKLRVSKKGLGPRALPDAYGRLDFCHRDGHPNPVLLPEEMRSTFPELEDVVNGNNYFFFEQLQDEPRRLGLILVDCKKSPDYNVQRILRRQEQLLKNDALRQLAVQRTFYLQLVTGTAQKQRELNKAIGEARETGQITLEVELFVSQRLFRIA